MFGHDWPVCIKLDNLSHVMPGLVRLYQNRSLYDRFGHVRSG